MNESIWLHLDQLTKPPRSLGRLEELAARLCRVQGTLRPETTPRRLVLFAGDHGVLDEGVSAWPASVTAAMIDNIQGGGAASAVFARQTNTELRLLDVGSLRPTADAYKVRQGTRNLAREPALTVVEFHSAFALGQAEAERARQDGVRVIAAGEMGIGNTTPAACLTMLLADAPLDKAVGRGAGSDDVILKRKLAVVADAVQRARSVWSADPVAALAAVSGIEIVAMAGLFAGAHEAKLTIVLDGYVATAAALIAEHLRPGVCTSMIAAHLSAEGGHAFALKKLELMPVLEWNMRLGEGTGALLLMPLLDCASAMVTQMATFAATGIARKGPQ